MIRNVLPIIMALTCLLVITNFITWTVIPDNFWLNFGTTLVILISLISQGIYYRAEVLRFLRAPQFRQWRSYTLTLVLLFFILSLISHLAYKNDFYLDLSGENNHALSDLSKKLVQKLDKPLSVTAFVSAKDRLTYDRFLDLYQNLGKEISVEYIDPNTSPVLVKKYGVTKYGQMVLSYGDKKVLADQNTEQSFTQALNRLLSDQHKVIYYTVGHREIDFNSNQDSGGSYFAKLVGSSGIAFRPLNLLTQQMPTDISALFIAGPIDPFSKEELAKLEGYLVAGGRLILSLSPQLKSTPLKELRALMQKLGVEISSRVVLDRLAPQQNVDPTILIFKEFKSAHPSFAQFSQRTVFPVTSDIDWNENATLKLKYTPLITTAATPATWSESDSLSLLAGKVTLSDDDKKCPCAIAGLFEEVMKSESEAMKVAAIGNGNFFINGYKSHAGNFNFLLNLFNWTVGDHIQIVKNRPELLTQAVIMSAPHLRAIFVVTVVLCPLALFLLALFFHRRRLSKA
jgi:ABC-type uncharacterized transport system involved in gliding motility auxiliary subunit